MRSEMSEERVPLALESLDIDHVMPQSWYSHWPLPDGSTVSPDEVEAAKHMRFVSEGRDPKTEAILRRQEAIPCIGNLTLVHYGVNRSLQNHAYGAKRQALFEHSNLQLNRSLMQREAWDESAIMERGEELAKFATRIWPGPA